MKKDNFIYIVLFVFLLICSIVVVPTLSRGGDNAGYLILAESLVKGEGFKLINYPIDNYYITSPILLSSILSILFIFFGKNFLVYNFVGVIFSLIALYFMYRYLKNYTSIWKARVAILLTATNPIFIIFSTRITSESLYFMFASIFFCLYLKYQSTIKVKKTNPIVIFVLIFSIVLMYYTRTAGIILFASFIIYNFLLKRYGNVFFSFIYFLLFYLPWWLRNHFLSSKRNTISYLTYFLQKETRNPGLGNIDFSFLIERFFNNSFGWLSNLLPSSLFFLVYEGVRITDLIDNLYIYLLSIIIGLLISSVFIYGFFIKINHKFDLVDLYVILHFFAHQFISYPLNQRLLVIAPFLFVYFLIGAEKLFNYFKLNSKRYITYLLILIISLNVVAAIGISIRDHTYTPPEWESYYDVADWIKANTLPNSVVITREPELFYEYTGRFTDIYPFSTNTSEILSFLDSRPTNYVIVDAFSPQTTDFLQPAIKEYADRFRLVYVSNDPKTYIYAFEKI